jgi:hypothetical protein
LLLRYLQRKKYCDYGHSFRWILKCQRNINRVTTTESFLKIVSTANARCSTDQRSMATEMLWISLEGRPRTNTPRQRFHSQLCYQIVGYFCRTLYFSAWVCVQNTLLYLNLTDCNKEITGTALWRVTLMLLVMWMSVYISFVLQCSVPITQLPLFL